MKREKYTQITWEDIFYYSKESPSSLKWKISPSYRIKVGDNAGTKSGTWVVIYKDKHYKCHVIVWALHFTLLDGFVIDHRNRNPMDNSLGNLQQIPQIKNMRNRSKRINNKSGVTGVYFGTRLGKEYWAATWNANRVKKEKCFFVEKYGNSEAFTMACQYRKDRLTELNREGDGYSEDHGQ